MTTLTILKMITTTITTTMIIIRIIILKFKSKFYLMNIQGTGFSDLAISLRRKYFMTDPRLFATIIAASDKPESMDRPSHPTQRPFTSMGTRTARFGNINHLFVYFVIFLFLQILFFFPSRFPLFFSFFNFRFFFNQFEFRI